jgi:hypothetical protein
MTGGLATALVMKMAVMRIDVAETRIVLLPRGGKKLGMKKRTVVGGENKGSTDIWCLT